MAVVGEVTVDVEMLNVAEDPPGLIVTVVGTFADVLVLLSVTVVFLTTAPERTTLPVELDPPDTLAGLTDILIKATGVIVRVAVFETDARSARMVATDLLETLSVSTPNDALVVPAATVTNPGNETRELGPDSLTRMPAEVAGPLKVTSPTLCVPELVDVGDKLTLSKTGALIVNAAVAELEPRAPLIATGLS